MKKNQPDYSTFRKPSVKKGDCLACHGHKLKDYVCPHCNGTGANLDLLGIQK